MGNTGIAPLSAAGAAFGIGNSGGSTNVPGPSQALVSADKETNRIAGDIRKNLDLAKTNNFYGFQSGKQTTDEQRNFASGLSFLQNASSPQGIQGYINSGKLNQDQLDYFRTQATGADSKDKILAIGTSLRKLVEGNADPETDAALLAVRRGKDVAAAKADAPGLRTQTLLGVKGNLNAPGTPLKKDETV